MSDIIVFVGPTLSAEAIHPLLDAEIRSPVSRGDVLDAALDKPAAIGIVDGYFAHVPSVWHEEILWAMSQGIHVFGAASMGALRAAELHQFGMHGVGTVFEQFKNGELTDDDEVAVIHAPKEFGYRSLSDAMVNIRSTLTAAQAEGIISPQTHSELVEALKARPYPERTFSCIFSKSLNVDTPEEESAALKQWLPQGRIDQKRNDAILMLQSMAEMQRAGWPTLDVNYRFAQTDAWEALQRDVLNKRRLREDDSKSKHSEQLLVEELIVSRRIKDACNGALARALCLELAQRLGVELNARAVEAAIDEFRREKGLLSPDQFERWLTSEDLTDDAIVEFFTREATVRSISSGCSAEMRTQLLDYLRANSELGKLRARAKAKQQELETRGLGHSGRELSDVQLWRWYFLEYLGHEVPVDIDTYAQSQQTTQEELRRAVLREYLFVHGPETPTCRDQSAAQC